MEHNDDTQLLARPNAPSLGATNKSAKIDKRKIRPYSKLIDRGALGSIAGDSREGRFLIAYEKLLTDHIGNPDPPTRLLITRASRLALHLELLDEKAITRAGGLTPTDCHFYAVWSNALARHLSKLQFAGGHSPSQPLADIMAEVDNDG